MQSDRQDRISERAYQIWIAEGRVHGHHDEHWQCAERAIAEEEIRLAAALADRASGGGAAGTSGTAARRRKQATAAGAKKPGTAATGKSRATAAAPRRRDGRRAPTGPFSS